MAAPGRFVWLDLVTENKDRARTFYTELFNWDTEDQDMGPMGTYTMWKLESDRSIGGLMDKPPNAKKAGAPDHWLAYITVDDVDATAAKIKENGGQVMAGPHDIPNVGRFVVALDPQGGVFAPFKGEDDDAMADRPKPPENGDFAWHELMTPDPAAALEFYTTIFNWEKGDAMDMGEGGTYQIFNRGGEGLGGIMKLPPQAEGAPASWVHYTTVEDTDAAIERAKSLGAKLLHGPMDVPGGRVAMFQDPVGAVFAVWSGEDQS